MGTKLIRISPSIIATDYNNDEMLKNALVEIEKAGASMVYLDVMDGKFVPATTFDYNFVSKVRDMTTLLLDVHLMIDKPEKVIDKYIDAGADIITIHSENNPKVLDTLKYIKSKNVVAGLAVSPKTSLIKVMDLINSGFVDIALIMSVEPGACGQAFIPGSAEKIAELRDLNKKVYIEVDGGVNTKNAWLLRKMGVNIIVSGSTIFSSNNLKKTIKQLKGRDFSSIIKKFFK